MHREAIKKISSDVGELSDLRLDASMAHRLASHPTLRPWSFS